MSKDFRGVATVTPQFDKVKVNGGLIVNDISRFNYNSEARYRQDVVATVTNNYPAAHVVGKLVDGKYVIASFKGESIVRNATIVVVEPFDKPVKIKVGTASAEDAFVAQFDCTQARGTMVLKADCNIWIEEGVNDDVIATVTGASDGDAGKVAIILDVSKLGASTLMPSN